MMGIQLLKDPSLDQVSRTKKGDFFSGAGSLRKGEKEGWEKDFDLVQGESGYLFSTFRLVWRGLKVDPVRARPQPPKNQPLGAVEESTGGNLP